MLRPTSPAALALAPGLLACTQLLQRVATSQTAAAVPESSSAGGACSASGGLPPGVETASVQSAGREGVQQASRAFPAALGRHHSSISSNCSGSTTAAVSGRLAGSSGGKVCGGGGTSGDRGLGGTAGGPCGSEGGAGGRGGGSGEWRWGHRGGDRGGDSGSGAGGAVAAAAAVAAAVAALAFGGTSVALADAAAAQDPFQEGLTAARQALATAWAQTEEDIARTNARLPANTPSIKGETPSASLVHDALEVVVPVREGADAEAVLKELRRGLGSRGSVSYSESMYGASRTVQIEVRPYVSSPETWLRLQMFVPPPGGVEQAQVVVSKRAPFTAEELAALGDVVRAANLTSAPDRPAHGASARRHGLHGGLGPDRLSQHFHEMLSELPGMLRGPLGQMLDDMERELRGQGGEGDGDGDDGSFGGSGFSGGSPWAPGGGFPAPSPSPFPLPGGSTDPSSPLGSGGPRPRLPGGGAGPRSTEAGGHDWGSPAAKQAVEYLMSIGAQVFPPGNKAEMDWGVLAGYEDQKRTIEDCLLLPLLRPDVYARLAKATRKAPANIRPRAVLFEGPPGTGKTTSARVISSQAAVPLIYVPLEAVLSKWYGESEQQLGAVFKAAEAMGGAIIFFDELDALGGNRSAGGLHEASRRMLSVLLREMEGFDAETKRTVVIGATNRKADLDPALLSRFDLVLTFGLPDAACRSLILRQYARQLSDPELQRLADRTPGMSGRDLRDVCEHTERRWASKIIRGEVGDEALPPLPEYLASAEERATAVQHVQQQADAAGALNRLLGATGGGGLPSWLGGWQR